MPVNNLKPVKAVSIGTAASLAVIVIVLCVITGVMMMLPSIPTAALPYIVLVADAVGVLIGGYITAAIAGSKGLILGLICGICVFLILLIIGQLSGNTAIGTVTFIRLGVLALFGILGGIKGVNRKEKLHIK